MELWQQLGTLHPKLVQIPLVLLLAGLLFDAAGLLFRNPRAAFAGLCATAAGTIGLLFAFICGIYAEIWAGRSGIPQHPIELHELMANISSWGFVILFAWRIFLAERTDDAPTTTTRRSRALRFYVILGLSWYVLLALTGWLGGQLVFEYGAAVRGGGLNVLSLSDLNTLATRQTDENLRYSEWMHHVFGYLTLGLGLSLVAQTVWPKAKTATTIIIPLALLAGGIFLFFMADRDLYALTDPRQWRDREVQLHKTLALVMTTIGAGGLWRWRKTLRQNSNTTSSPPSPTARAESATPAEPRDASRLVAVLALIGGAMLFTHVHTVAPYANVAAGVYIAHVVMGVVALTIGATRVAQEHLKTESLKRAMRFLFAGAMTLEAALLITYNEGLPFFLGYGDYERWASPQHGDTLMTVAPFGNFRAILSPDTDNGTAYVAIRQRFRDKDDNEIPVTLTLDAPPILLITRPGGGGEIAVELARSNSDDPRVGSNFQGSAPFIKNMPLVCARLILKIDGHERVGYFDPWVTPLVQPVPENLAAAYVCPMHEGVKSAAAGNCPICGMPLIKIAPPRQAGKLHDDAFTLAFESSPAAESGAAELRFTPTKIDNGQPKPCDLAVVHEQKIHLFILSPALDFFDHLHPQQNLASGTAADQYLVNYHFPAPGQYLLFADLTPRGDREQVFRFVVQAGADGSVHELTGQSAQIAPAALSPDAATAKLSHTIPAPAKPTDAIHWTSRANTPDDTLLELLSQPRSISAGLHDDLVFRLADAQARPLTNLQPYLGALGHCVAISQDTNDFIHIHPETWQTPDQLRAAGPTAGPLVGFHALFPKAGRWKLFAQFIRNDNGHERMIVAEFTVQVTNPFLPVTLWQFLLGE